MLKRLLSIISFLVLFAPFGGTLHAQLQDRRMPPVFLQSETPWADSLIQTMDLKAKIGQLFMVAAYSNRDAKHVKEIETLISEYQVGGLIFMQGGPQRQAILNNKYQEMSEIPLLISMDAEWGLGMRLDSVLYYPRQMTLGATNDDNLIYDFGLEQSRQLNRMGVHVSFSPVVDVNSNPDNPVIGNRAFGEDRMLVSRLGEAYMRGLQDGGVLANVKHFPGHGDTDTDSHKTLPSILHSRERLDSMELYPFRTLFNKGAGSVMIAHLNIPALDSSGLPSTLSRKITHDLLREELGFQGLVFTDALNMRGIADIAGPGDAEFKALLAGNDILLFAGDVPTAAKRIQQAIETGEFTEEALDEHVLRILRAKEWCQVAENDSVRHEGLYADLLAPSGQAIQRRVIEGSLTVLKNEKKLLPLRGYEGKKVAILDLGVKKASAFSEQFQQYMDADVFVYPKPPDFSASQKIESELSQYDLVIVNLLDASNRPSKNWGVTNQSMRIISALNSKTTVAVNLFTNPYALRNMRGIERVNGLMVAYQDDPLTQQICAEAMVGGAFAKGTLPVNCGLVFPAGSGDQLDQLLRLRHAMPEFEGLNSDDLLRIDSIALEGIKEQAYPGCRVLVIKNGSVVVDRSYGYQTYENKIPVDGSTIYDLASITKIVASTASLMRLQDEGKLDLDHNLCDYITVPDTSSCYNMNLREMLSHYAQLPAWIPFYMNTIDKGELRPELYRKQATRGFTTEVAENLFIRDSYADSIYQELNMVALRPEKEYKYSDLGYYFLQKVIEKTSGTTLEHFVDSVFYQPMGLSSMGYLPLERQDIKEIAPTEYDMLFRKQLVHGHVHDPGAAMLGGVGGHAGVFANAEDLAIMMQMFINDGEYGGVQYIQPSTLQEYTTCHYCYDDNRRGVGFDKPALEPDSGPTCNDASSASFGHSGFTGTLAWADPEEDLVYVFLSNRVYPNADNRKLLKMDIRTNIQQVIYDAIRAQKQRENQDLLGELAE
ncbi:MAG: serine hydrolase [Flavobacteriales bacterium]|nr:serine hydrolase [Flavobacteriales bacterium]